MCKINQREFEVLPELWQKLINHKKNLEILTSEFFIDVDLNSLSEAELKEFVDKLTFDPFIKKSILSANDKNQQFKTVLLFNGRHVLQASYQSFLYYFQEVKIFLTDEIQIKGQEIAEFLNSTLTVFNLFLSQPTKETKEAAKRDFSRNFEQLTFSLGDLIQKRLKFPED